MSTFSEFQPTPIDDSAGTNARPLEPIVLAEVVGSQQPQQTSMPTTADTWPPRRRVARPAAFFIATCFTTFLAGCYNWAPVLMGTSLEFVDRLGRIFSISPQRLVKDNWANGLVFMFGVMSVLLFHEMGHFLMTVRYKVRASFPYFIPFPIMVTGTMGAVIAMDGRKANRKQLFDIGIAGPLAGLALAVPFTVIGILQADYTMRLPQANSLEFGDPLLVTAIAYYSQQFPTGATLIANPIFMAGWFGLLVTGLNMMPVSQLDGGHVIHALFGTHGRWVARAFFVTVVLLMAYFGTAQWILMLVLVVIIGVSHPPSADDTVNIGTFRRILGAASLAIPILCFPPVPLTIH